MEFTKSDIVALIPNLTPRLVQYYTEEGIVCPSRGGQGRGNSRKYSTETLCEFAIIGELVRWKTGIQIIKKVVELLRKNGSDLRKKPNFNAPLLLCLVRHADGKIEPLLTPGQRSRGQIYLDKVIVNKNFSSIVVINVYDLLRKLPEDPHFHRVIF